MTSVFASLQDQAWPYTYHGRLHIGTLCGGIPADEKTARAWITAKLKDTRSAAEIEDLVLRTMADRKITQDEAIEHVALKELAGTNGFKRTEQGQLFIEGRQLKSALKEAVSVAVSGGKLEKGGWGATRKGLMSYFAEHVFIPEERLLLHRDGEPVTDPSGVAQKMIHTWRGDAISYEEFCQEVDVDFTVKTDHHFTWNQWGMVWCTGEFEGIGASRSQGFGRYEVTVWDEISPKQKYGKRAAAGDPDAVAPSPALLDRQAR